MLGKMIESNTPGIVARIRAVNGAYGNGVFGRLDIKSTYTEPIGNRLEILDSLIIFFRHFRLERGFLPWRHGCAAL